MRRITFCNRCSLRSSHQLLNNLQPGAVSTIQPQSPGQKYRPAPVKTPPPYAAKDDNQSSERQQEGGDSSRGNNKKSLFSPFLLLHSHGESGRGIKKNQMLVFLYVSYLRTHRGGKNEAKREEGSNVSPRPQLHNFGVRLCLQQQPRDPSGSY